MGQAVRPALDFTGKAVLITGASAGIGYEAAKLFLGGGAVVAVNGASARGAAVAEELGAIFLQGDIADIGTCRGLIRKTVEAFGRIDILVNNAGLVPVGTALDADEEQYDRAFDVNVKGAFFLSKFAIERMRTQGGGAIVNTGSIAGLIGPKNRAVYAATKGALIAMTRAMAADHASDNIRVNCVCPGMVMSPSLEERIAATADPEKTRSQFESAIPLGRIGSAAEAAMMICVAASAETGFMTGSVLTIDGGASL